MKEKYVKLSEVRKKLNYIFRSYGVGDFVRKSVKKALDNLAYVVEGQLESTLDTTISDSAHTVDVAPVVHAEWIQDEDHSFGEWLCYCSNCDEEVSCSSEILPLWKYCPGCGAKMDGNNKS